jgi:hypothetical protein
VEERHIGYLAIGNIRARPPLGTDVVNWNEVTAKGGIKGGLRQIVLKFKVEGLK